MVKKLVRDRNLLLMLVPFILYYLIFFYKPLYGLQVAFKDYSLFKGMAASPWNDFGHFRTFFAGPYFYRTIKNTVMISLYNLIFGFPIPILFALLLNEVRKTLFRKTIQTLTFLPYLISTVVIAGLVTDFLSPSTGLVNMILDRLGFERQYFLMMPEYFRTIFVSMGIWKYFGFNAIIFIAALAGINQELYESAVIDGANRWRRIWHVSLPGIVPTIMIMLLLQIGTLMDVSYEEIILLYQPSTYVVSDVVNSYVYRAGISQSNYGYATAVGLFNSTVNLLLVIGANQLSKRLTNSGLW